MNTKDPVSEKKAKLASDDPTFPPLRVRLEVLLHTHEMHLIPWAQQIDQSVTTKDGAIRAILVNEFGEAAYNEAIKRVNEVRERRVQAREEEAKKLAQAMLNHPERFST